MKTSPSLEEAGAATSPLVGVYWRYAMGLLLAVSVVNYIDRQVLNILLEPIKHELHLADWQLGLLTGLAFGLLYAALGVPIARLAERGDRPLILTAAMVVWSSFTAACGFVWSFPQLLAARVGVGFGEAGCVPTSQSLIMDYAEPKKRGSALAVFGLGAPLGALIGLAFGGLVAHAYGWRIAFMLAGGPGLLLAILVAFTLPEPRRALSRRAGSTAAASASLGDMFRLVRAKRSYWLLAAAMTMHVFIDTGFGVFVASFFLRNHRQQLTELASAAGQVFGFNMGAIGFLGVALGLLSGVGGCIGMWCGGQIADRFGPADPRRYCYAPALAMLLAAPCGLALLSAPSAGLAFAGTGVVAILSLLYYGPAMTAWFSLVAPDMRATNSAIMHLIVSLLGVGLAPVTVGLVSDWVGARLGPAEGVRWALMLLMASNLIGALLFWLAAGPFRQETEG